MAAILLVEPDPVRRDRLAGALDGAGHDVTAVGTGLDARVEIETSRPDVVVLDPALPDVDGLDLCRRLRVFPGSPIIAVTAEDTPERQLDLFDAGADDVVAEPFDVGVLAARVRVQLRHAQLVTRPAGDVLTLGRLRIDTAAHEAELSGRALSLSAQQFTILRVLMRNAGSAVPRDLIARVLGQGRDAPNLANVRIAVSRLRRALGDEPGAPRITALRTGGYRLELPLAS